MTTNRELQRRREDAVPRGVSTLHPIFVARAKNAELWDVEGKRYIDFAGGIPVPASAVVFIAPWVLHRHRRLWAQPEIFDPARFLPGAPPPDRFAYMPFGIGPRVCVGAQFALTEATLVLASLIRAFHIERAGTEPVVPIAIVTTQPDHPPLFRLRPRR